MGLCLSTRRRSPPLWWSDLPPELGGLILRRLPSHEDRFSFRAVCRQWRLAAQLERSSLPPALPWIRLTDLTFRSLPGGELRRLNGRNLPCPYTRACAAIRFRSCSSDRWPMYCNSTVTGLFLINPFTGATMFLPPAPQEDEESLKIVVCSPDIVAATLYGRMAVGICRKGAPSWSVFPLAYGCRRRLYEDIAFHRGKIYAITQTDDLYSHELVDGVVAEHVIKEQPPGTNGGQSPRYLVAACGKLLMVKWTCNNTCLVRRRVKRRARDYWWDDIRLMVFEADLEMGRWLELKDGGLDGHALFVSRNSSKAIPLSSSNDRKIKKDHVYFPGTELQWIDRAFRSCLYGCYDLRNDRISLIVWNKGSRNTKDIHAVSDWFFPSM